MNFRLKETPLPQLDETPAYTVLERSVYEDRLEMLLRRASQDALDAIVVYGDREHVGNITYLTGFDPRFEEALLVILRNGEISLLVGNEGMAYAAVSPIEPRLILCQSLSLLGQARDKSPLIGSSLTDAGLAEGQRIGVIGWKYFLPSEAAEPDTTLDVPSFIADALRNITSHDQVLNVTGLMMHPESGIRTRLEAEQILAFDASCHAASLGVARAINALAPNMTETALAGMLGYDGRPLNYHPIVTSAERTRLGLASPSSRRIQQGDPVFLAMGGWGANTVRAGYAVGLAEEAEQEDEGYIAQVVAPYMSIMAAWYEAVGTGARAGDVHDGVMAQISGRISGIALNPGHHIHIDEWVSSPFEAGSDISLRSGMMLQMDIIPVVEGGRFGTNAEDGIVLADRALRDELQRLSPGFWARVQKRRAFMDNEIGISLHESVLPMSEIQGWLAPLLLAPRFAMSRR